MFSFYEYACGRYALNGRVTCSPDSLISYPHFLYHVPPARVLVCFLSVLRVFPYVYVCTNMDCRLVPSYLSVSRFLLLSHQLVRLRFSLMPFPFMSGRLVCRLVISGLMTSSDSFVYLRLVSLLWIVCTCISHTAIYTGWRCGTVPHLQSTLQPP